MSSFFPIGILIINSVWSGDQLSCHVLKTLSHKSKTANQVVSNLINQKTHGVALSIKIKNESTSVTRLRRATVEEIKSSVKESIESRLVIESYSSTCKMAPTLKISELNSRR